MTAVKSKWTTVQWLIVVLASIGFAFDIYELLMAPLIMKPAILELTGAKPGSNDFRFWGAMLFYLPALFGGIIGLFGGYLTDRLGRRRVLTWSILLYACSAFAAGYSTNIYMLLFFRCTTFVGVCVEFVAAVAWLSELFTDPHERERVLGYTQAFSSFGGLLVAVASGICIEYGKNFPAIGLPDFLSTLGEVKVDHAAWRYTLMSGVIPALPLILIRPFLPESPIWKQKKDSGTLKRPSILALFSPEYRRVTIVTTIMFACSYGAAFGAIQQIPQIVPGLADVKESLKDVPGPAKKEAEQKIASEYVKVQEVGGLVGRVLLALLLLRIASRRKLLRVFQGPGLIILPLVFWFFLKVDNQTFFTIDLSWMWLGKMPITTVSIGVFLCGLVTVAQFSFWGNYLPRVYPVHLRGTGESFAANIGGRLFGTSMAAVTQLLAAPGDKTLSLAEVEKLAPFELAKWAAIVGFTVYLIGSIACFWLPEPSAEELPD